MPLPRNVSRTVSTLHTGTICLVVKPAPKSILQSRDEIDGFGVIPLRYVFGRCIDFNCADAGVQGYPKTPF